MSDWTLELLSPPRSRGPIARLSAPCKLSISALLAVWVVVVDQPIALAIPVIAVAAFIPFESLRTVQLRALLFGAIFIMWGIMFSQGVFYAAVPREAILTIIPPMSAGSTHYDGLHLYREGLLYGLTQSLRFISLFWFSLLITFTTPMHQLLGALNVFRMPASLGLLVLIALRSLPTLAREVLEVRRALKLRRIPFRRIGLSGVLAPLLDRLLWRAHTLDASLQLRGIDPLNPHLGPSPRISGPEVIGLSLAGLCVGAAVIARILMVLYWRGWWYAPDATVLYRWAAWLNTPGWR